MDPGTVVAVASALAAVLAGIVATRRWARPRRAAGHWSAPAPPGATAVGPDTVVVDVAGADPGDPAVRRLAEAIGREALVRTPDLDHVTVTDADGRMLTVVRHPDPLPDIRLPDALSGPHPRHARGLPEPAREHAREGAAATDTDAPALELVSRPLTARYELPASVRAELRDDDDGTELVRAILAAAGHEVTVAHGVVRTGDDAILVLGDARAGGLSHDDLSAAFLRYRRSGARRGVVVHLGYVDPREVARREELAPDLVYAGADTLQRMLDAVAIGLDPLRFVPMLATS